MLPTMHVLLAVLHLVCRRIYVGVLALLKVVVRYNLRNLLVRWRTTVLTALAFTLVVCLLTVMLAFVNGMTRLTEASGQPGNVMILSDGATDELFSNLAPGDIASAERQPGVERDDLGRPLCSEEVYIVVSQPIPPALAEPENPGAWGTALACLRAVGLASAPAPGPSVRGKIKSIGDGGQFVLAGDDGQDRHFRLAPDARFPVNTFKADEYVLVVCEQQAGDLLARELRGSDKRRFVQVRGLGDAGLSSRVHSMDLYPGGKWFSSAGVQDLPGQGSGPGTLPAIQAVLGEGVAQILGKDQGKERLEPGDTFELGPRKWVVTGITRSAGSTFGSEIWAKHSVVGPLFGKDQFTCLVVRTKDAPTASQVAEFFRNDYKPAVRAEPETEYYAKLSETNKQFSIAIYFVTIIMAIGGVFGVMNTMFAAISQRTKDIGVLRILGFARWQILVSFFLETLVIALAGGLLGGALGYLCDGWTATSIISSGQGGGAKTVVLKLTVDADILAVGVLFTLVMGALGGLVPSLSAMRLRPLESLR